MACDLQATHRSGMKVSVKTKILELDEKLSALYGTKKALLGFSGGLNEIGTAVQWLVTQEGRPPRFRDLEVLMLTPDGLYYATNSLVNFIEIKEKHMAIGSGMPYASAAMESGKSPKDAVKVAAKYDVNTGKDVKEYKL